MYDFEVQSTNLKTCWKAATSHRSIEISRPLHHFRYDAIVLDLSRYLHRSISLEDITAERIASTDTALVHHLCFSVQSHLREQLLSISIVMDSVHDASSIRVSKWLDSSDDASSLRSDSQTRGGVPLPDYVSSTYDNPRTIPTSIGLVTRQGLRNQQVPTGSNTLHFTVSGITGILHQQNLITSPDDKSRYTSRLMEYGQKKHVLPTYEYSTISQTPSNFRCRVRLQGINTSATAPSKKLAKHQASFNACNMLGIGPN